MNWRLKTVFTFAGLVFAVALTLMMGCASCAQKRTATTQEQLAYQEGYTAGYKAGKDAQQDADYKEAMRQGREALAILEKWDRAKKAAPAYTLNGQPPMDACKGAK